MTNKYKKSKENDEVCVETEKTENKPICAQYNFTDAGNGYIKTTDKTLMNLFTSNGVEVSSTVNQVSNYKKNIISEKIKNFFGEGGKE